MLKNIKNTIFIFCLILILILTACQSSQPPAPNTPVFTPSLDETPVQGETHEHEETHPHEEIDSIPDTADGYMEAALENYEVGNFDLALQHLNQAIEKSPDFVDAYYYRGLTQAGLNEYALAIADLEHYLSLNIDAPDKDNVLNLISSLEALSIALRPVALALDGDTLWVANALGNNVMTVNTTNGSIEATYPVAGQPFDLLIANQALWIAISDHDQIVQLNLSNGQEMGRFKLRDTQTTTSENITPVDQPVALAADEEFLWVANYNSHTISKLNLSDGSVEATFEVGQNPRDLLVEGESIWVVNEGDDTLSRLNKSDGALIGTYPIIADGFKGASPQVAILLDDAIWVGSTLGISKLQISDGSLLGTYQSGAGVVALLEADNALWGLSYVDGLLNKHNLSDGAMLDLHLINTVLAPSNLLALLRQEQFLWIADAENDALHKVEESSGQVLATYDLGGRPFPADNPTRLPQLHLTDTLFRPEQGTDNLHEATSFIYGNDDWLLIANTSESILPIPRGWRTVEAGPETYILFGETGDDIEKPNIRIRVGAEGYMEDFLNSEQALATYEADLAQREGITILKREIIDNDKSYIFLETTSETGEARYLLQIFSRYSAKKWFFTYSVFTAQADWERYYPLIQAMVARWASLDNSPIGFNLPDDLTR